MGHHIRYALVITTIISCGIWAQSVSTTIVSSNKSVQKPLEKSALAPSQKKMITINNKITKQATGYHYIFMHYPTLDIRVNNKLIGQGETAQVEVKNNKLLVRYDYKFGSHRQGAKIIEFKLNPGSQSHDLTFSWDDEWRVQVENATPVKRTIIE